MENELKLGHFKEEVLDDNYQVYMDYLYVADGKVIRSDISGKVWKLKQLLNATEIKSCDTVGRNLRIYG
jgi:hypothetical protein